MTRIAYPSPRRVGLHICQSTLELRKMLRDALVFLDGVHGANVQVSRAKEENLRDKVGLGSYTIPF